jgi:hypothetical protein
MTLIVKPGFNGMTDTDAIAYVNAVEAADGQLLEFGVGKAINDFVVGCKQDGIWTAIKASCILAGARTLAGALVPLVGTAPTSVGFVGIGTDYVRKTGLIGNGTTKYLTQSESSSRLQNSAHQSIYLSTNATSFPFNFATHISQFPSTGTDGQTQISTNATDTFVRCRSNSGSTLNNVSLGLTGISRSSSANYTRRVGGSNVTITEASTGIPAQIFYVYVNPALLQYSDARLAFYSIGESLNLALLDARVSALITAFGVAIP